MVYVCMGVSFCIFISFHFIFIFIFLLSFKELHVHRACFFLFSCKMQKYRIQKKNVTRGAFHTTNVSPGCEERRKKELKVGHLLMRWELEHGATPPAALPLHLQLSARKYSKQDTTIPASKPKKSATRGLEKSHLCLHISVEPEFQLAVFFFVFFSTCGFFTSCCFLRLAL